MWNPEKGDIVEVAQVKDAKDWIKAKYVVEHDTSHLVEINDPQICKFSLFNFVRRPLKPISRWLWAFELPSGVFGVTETKHTWEEFVNMYGFDLCGSTKLDWTEEIAER